MHNSIEGFRTEKVLMKGSLSRSPFDWKDIPIAPTGPNSSTSYFYLDK